MLRYSGDKVYSCNQVVVNNVVTKHFPYAIHLRLHSARAEVSLHGSFEEAKTSK